MLQLKGITKNYLSGDNEGELSMCNLSQRTKSIFKYINLI